jgi:hypothetical protein
MTRNLTKQSQPRPRDIVYRTRNLTTPQLTAPLQHSSKPVNNASQVPGKGSSVAVSEARQLSVPKQHSPAVTWWLDQDRKTQAWHHLAIDSRLTSTTDGGRPNLRDQTNKSHFTSRNPYSDGATAEHSSQMQGSVSQQGKSPPVLRDTATLASCHSRLDGQCEDLMCIGHLFT